MTRDQQLDKIKRRLDALKLAITRPVTSRDIDRLEREAQRIYTDLQAIPPLPANHIEQLHRAAMRASWQQITTAPGTVANGSAVNQSGNNQEQPQ